MRDSSGMWMASRRRLLIGLGVPGAQVAFEDLSARVLGQGGGEEEEEEEEEAFGYLKTSKMLRAVPAKFIGRELGAGLAHNHRGDGFDPLGVGYSEHGDLGHAWVKVDRLFDFAAGHQLQSGQAVPLASFPEGDYRLEIKVIDELSSKSVTRNVNFTVASTATTEPTALAPAGVNPVPGPAATAASTPKESAAPGPRVILAETRPLIKGGAGYRRTLLVLHRTL